MLDDNSDVDDLGNANDGGNSKSTDKQQGGKNNNGDQKAEKPIDAFKAACKSAIAPWKPGTRALDVILGGRMLASTTRDSAFCRAFKVDAAGAFAHLMTTNAVVFESDFFSAIDDLTKDACHLGSNEFGSGCYYSYVTIDLNALEAGLGSAEDMAEAARCIIVALSLAEPPARQATAASKSPTFLTFAVVHGMQTSLWNAFELPVSVQPGGGMGLSQVSAAKLDKHWRQLARYYGQGKIGESFEPTVAAAACFDEDAANYMPGISRWIVESLEAAATKIHDALTSSGGTEPGTRTAGRFLDVHLLKPMPLSCPNRDDQNMPKRCDIGGFTRMRISSQCYKRAVRTYLEENYKGTQGRRSKRIHENIMEKLGIGTGDQVGRFVVASIFTEALTAMKSACDPLNHEGLDESDMLVFLGDDEIDAIAQLIRESWGVLEPLAKSALNEYKRAKRDEDKRAAEKKAERATKGGKGKGGKGKKGEEPETAAAAAEAQ